MGNLSSFIQTLIVLLLVLSLIINFGQRIEKKSLTKKFALLKKMFWEESDSFNDNRINNASIDSIEKLKEEIIYFYTKLIKEWDPDEPDEIGYYFLELERLEDNKKRLTLTSFFRQAMASNDNLAAIYFTAFKFELEIEYSDSIKALQTTKNLILDNALKTGKGSRQIKTFYFLLEVMPLENHLSAEKMVLFEAEMAKIKTILFNKSDII